MNVDIQSSAGLRVYRELIEKETGAPARWEQTFGVKSQLQPKRSLLLVNDFEAAVSLPLPLSMQLFQLGVTSVTSVTSVLASVTSVT
jgi:hypothetical protein